MLRELNVNLGAQNGAAPTASKSFPDSLQAPPSLANAGSTMSAVVPAGSTVYPVPPFAALAELEAIRQRLLVLVQGMSAWNALPQTGEGDTFATDPMGQQALVKLRENEALLDQCKVLQSLQQQLSQERLSLSSQPTGTLMMPSAQRESSEKSQSIPSIFALPQPVSQSPPQVISRRNSTPSSGSRAGASPILAAAEGQQACPEPRAPSRDAGNHPRRDKPQSRREISANVFNPNSSVRRVPWPPQKDCILLIVEFKRQRMKRCISDTVTEPGKYVIIPGDRGYDCGLVIQCGRYDVAISQYVEDTLRTMDAGVVDPEQLKGDMIPVMRDATPEEVQQLYSTQAAKERMALKKCRELVERLRLRMNVVDCEYQFDGTKISFYFEAEHAIDFRDLNKELYRIFSARIWLENVNSAVKNVVPEGAMSKSDKALFKRSGQRVPVTY